MNEITLSAETLDKLNNLLANNVSAELAQHNEYQHGRMNGMLLVANLVLGEEKPMISVPGLYATAKASNENLGLAALQLLFEMPGDTEDTPFSNWLEKRRQLLECWDINTKRQLQESMNADLPEPPPHRNGVLMINGESVEFASVNQLYAIKAVEDATNVSGGAYFRRLVVVDKQPGEVLAAEHLVNGQSQLHLIGRISVRPKWLNLACVADRGLS